MFGCVVPEDFEIELKNYDNFTVMCNVKVESVKWAESANWRELSKPLNLTTLTSCLSAFIQPEELDDESVFCQKCDKNTGANKACILLQGHISGSYYKRA